MDFLNIKNVFSYEYPLKPPSKQDPVSTSSNQINANCSLLTRQRTPLFFPHKNMSNCWSRGSSFLMKFMQCSFRV